MSRKGSTFALIAQGLLKCGCDPEPWLVNELIDASSPKVPRMDIGDLQTLAHVSGRLGGGKRGWAVLFAGFEAGAGFLQSAEVGSDSRQGAGAPVSVSVMSACQCCQEAGTPHSTWQEQLALAASWLTAPPPTHTQHTALRPSHPPTHTGHLQVQLPPRARQCRVQILAALV